MVGMVKSNSLYGRIEAPFFIWLTKLTRQRKVGLTPLPPMGDRYAKLRREER